MRSLFDPRSGDGLDFLRQPIGASDFVAKHDYTFDDMPAGSTDYQQRHFTISHDRKKILPLLRQALRINPRITIMGTPWSPPAWMKSNDSLVGGRLIDDPRDLPFVRALPRQVRAGLPARRRSGRLSVGAERAAEPHARAATPARTCLRRRRRRSSSSSARCFTERTCGRRSSATTTTGRCTRTTSRTPRRTRNRTSTTTRRSCSPLPHRATSPGRPTTATTATRPR